MSYTEEQKEKAMKAMCEICEMCSCYGDKWECIQYKFPCSIVTEAFDKVIEILEEQ